MKKKLIFLSLIILMSSTSFKTSTEYDLAKIYSGEATDSGSKVLTDGGNLEDAKYLLSPLRIETGKYRVTLTKRGKDIYEIDDKGIFIQTRYCYEYATRGDAVLVVESNYGFTLGKVIFL